MDEFATIARYFAPLAGPGGLGLSDDAAVLTPPAGRDLVVTVDAMIENVHFLSADPPDQVARKLLRVNLSDLAAMGARPVGYVMTTGVPKGTDEAWFEAFTRGLAADQKEFGIQLLGGDTILSPSGLALSLTALGAVPTGMALRRSNAKPAEEIWVSGSIGDGYLGLNLLKGRHEATGEDAEYLAARYRLPEPRLDLGWRLVGVASAAIDVSDGLAADLGHICETSGVAATISLDAIPFSDAGRRALDAGRAAAEDLLTGGDDYELLFTAPAGAREAIQVLAAETRIPITRIGTTGEGEGVHLVAPDGTEHRLHKAGFTHF